MVVIGKAQGFFMQRTLPNLRSRASQSSSQRAYPVRSRKRTIVRTLAPLVTLLVVLGTWQAISVLELVKPFLIPAPGAVADKFWDVITDGDTLLDSTLWRHIQVTLKEVLLGLGIGLPVGMTLGYLIARSRLLEDLLSPVIVAFQSTPIVAYAPLLVIWFGSGIESKVLTCMLIVFFPMLMNTVVGIRNVPAELHDLMRVSQATRWQTFTKLELPAAMPVLMTGLKTSTALAVIGAVVGEFIVANAGLGFLINLARQQFDTPLVFVGVITLALMAGVLYAAASLLERRLLRWQRRG
jgi:NitT/TauT family transport system permease protein